eukprot:1224526-Prymnesium_polylepis.2
MTSGGRGWGGGGMGASSARSRVPPRLLIRCVQGPPPLARPAPALAWASALAWATLIANTSSTALPRSRARECRLRRQPFGRAWLGAPDSGAH